MNIENATYGYDSNNLQAAINNLNMQCITETIGLIHSGMASLRSAVDNCWVGQSAEKFKAKMDEDADLVAKSIADVGNACTASLNSFLNQMAEVDNNISF